MNWELRGRKELLDHRGDGPEVDELGRQEGIAIQGGHAVLDDAPQARKPDPQPALQKLAHRLKAPVAEVVDVVRFRAGIVVQTDDLFDYREKILQVQKAIVFLAVERQALVQLEAADRREIVAVRPMENGINQVLGGLNRGRIAGAEPAVDLQIGLVQILRDVLLEGRLHIADLAVIRFRKLGADIFVRSAEHPQKIGDRDLAVPVYLHSDRTVDVGFEFQPRAAVRDDLRAEELPVPPGHRSEINAGGPDELGDHHPLHAVDYESSPLGHLREIPEIDLLDLRPVRLLVLQPDLYMERGFIGGIPITRGRFVVFRLSEIIIIEKQSELLAGVIGYGRDLVQDLPQSVLQKPSIGFELDLVQIRLFDQSPESAEILDGEGGF